MERYFQQSSDVKLRDARPELHYQVGSCTRLCVRQLPPSFAGSMRHTFATTPMPDPGVDDRYLTTQVGVTPEGVEVPKAAHDAAVQAMIQSQPDGHRWCPLLLRLHLASC